MSGPRVEFRTTSQDQHDELRVYAQIKGHKNLSAYALYAAVTMMNKNPLTEAQKAKGGQVTG